MNQRNDSLRELMEKESRIKELEEKVRRRDAEISFIMSEVVVAVYWGSP